MRKTTPPVERSNTIAGRQAKRKQLSKLRKVWEAYVRKVTCDLKHIDDCIRMFDTEADTAEATKHLGRMGEMCRFVRHRLKEAIGPITSLEITQAWIADWGLQTDYETRIMIRKRVGSCLISLRNAGLYQAFGTKSEHKTWDISLDKRATCKEFVPNRL